MTLVSFSCYVCGTFILRHDWRTLGGYCSSKCSAQIRHTHSVDRNRFVAMCTSTESPDKRINLTPDLSAISALPVQAQEDLWHLLRDAANACCTKRQAECIELHFAAGLTQSKTAEALGVNQSTVAHSLYGIKVTSNRSQDASNQGKYYGGAIRKIRKELLCQPRQSQLKIIMTAHGN